MARLPVHDLSKTTVNPRLPDWRDSAGNGEAIPRDLIGATIVRLGAAPAECDIEGGGLVIDYVPKDAIDTKRLVLAFNELGMWIEN